ncbi:hypothetical protein [Burkholderia cepacia]|nr:hypothetical protein [Burkholderia cepacia]
MRDEANVNDQGRMLVAAARNCVARTWTDDPTPYDVLLGEARTLLERALDDNPDDIAVLTCLGAVLCGLRLYAEAREYLVEAIHLGSTDRNTYFNLFVAMLEHSSVDEARAVLKRGAGFAADPLTWEAYFDPHAM